MQKLSIRKISILGLVLMAASAVTAAVLPSKSDNKLARFDAGSLTNDSKAGEADPSSLTCAVDTLNEGISDGACNHSTGNGSESTGGDENSTSESSLHGTPPDGDGGLGADNTSDNS